VATMASSARRALPVLLAGVLLLGLGDSMAGPYLVLFGANEARLSPFQVGVFVSITAISGMAVSRRVEPAHSTASSTRSASPGRQPTMLTAR
jgi:SET family sugar efflux transporter-like MFS transporter